MMKLSNWTKERVSGVFKVGGWGESGRFSLFSLILNPVPRSVNRGFLLSTCIQVGNTKPLHM